MPFRVAGNKEDLCFEITHPNTIAFVKRMGKTVNPVFIDNPPIYLETETFQQSWVAADVIPMVVGIENGNEVNSLLANLFQDRLAF